MPGVRIVLAAFLIVAATGPVDGHAMDAAPETRDVHAFYYPWYGTPERGGAYRHWRHAVLGVSDPHTYPGGEEIGADFYPQGGCYSSSDPAVLARHMRQLAQAHIDVIAVSWLGAECFEARVLPALLDAAARAGIEVCIHLEPAVQQSAASVRASIVYLLRTYGDHPAFHRAPAAGDRPLFYAYDAYRLPVEAWARLLRPEGDLTLRKGPWDAAVLGLLLEEDDLDELQAAGFDGGYSYFAADGFSHAATSASWPELAARARERGLLFVPSVGPGYRDRRIRPWNRRTERERDQGRYYDCMFARAIGADPAIIAITSFNEWHEGTQIEPAVPFESDRYTYADYRPLAPEAYLDRTAAWVDRWHAGAGSDDVDATTVTDPAPCGTGGDLGRADHLARGRPIQISAAWDPRHAAGGKQARVDGRIGSIHYRDGRWQGFEGTGVVAEIDLERLEEVSRVVVGCLHGPAVWIFAPRAVLVEGSRDGREYVPLSSVDPPEASGCAPSRHAITIDAQLGAVPVPAVPGDALRIHAGELAQDTSIQIQDADPSAGRAVWSGSGDQPRPLAQRIRGGHRGQA